MWDALPDAAKVKKEKDAEEGGSSAGAAVKKKPAKKEPATEIKEEVVADNADDLFADEGATAGNEGGDSSDLF